MAVTNQQLADLMSDYVTATTAHTKAFIASVDKLIENDNRHHEQFRSRMGDLALAQAAIQAECKRNSEYRDKAAKFIIAAVLTPVGIGVISMIMK